MGEGSVRSDLLLTEEVQRPLFLHTKYFGRFVLISFFQIDFAEYPSLDNVFTSTEPDSVMALCRLPPLSKAE